MYKACIGKLHDVVVRCTCPVGFLLRKHVQITKAWQIYRGVSKSVQLVKEMPLWVMAGSPSFHFVPPFQLVAYSRLLDYSKQIQI